MRVSGLPAISLVGLLALSGCLGLSSEELEGFFEQVIEENVPMVRFIALGDMGTGDADQAAVAAALEKVCDELGCDFVIGLGDNIYEVGVTSHYDPQFELKFEMPYQGLDIPFYMSLGNHDNAGVRSGHAAGDFQVMYSERDDRRSDKWQMPGRWYVHEQEHVQFLALDTNIVFDNVSEVPALAQLLTNDVNAIKQTSFVKDTIEAPTDTTWRILYGHHPLYSNGEHGDTGNPWGSWLEETVCKTGEVDLFIAGHDHDLQWLAAKPDTCGSTEFIVSGAGAKTRPLVRDDHQAYFAKGDTLGFFWIQIAGNTLTGMVFDSDGELLFDRTIVRGTPIAVTALS